jgi:hypothetical protein
MIPNCSSIIKLQIGLTPEFPLTLFKTNNGPFKTENGRLLSSSTRQANIFPQEFASNISIELFSNVGSGALMKRSLAFGKL